MRYSCIVFLCALLPQLCKASSNDSIPFVSLSAATIAVSEGGMGAHYHIDSLINIALPFSSVGEQLSMGSVVNLRTYGAPGSLISGLAGGLSPDHLLVLWQGVPLNSPTLGMTDLSTLPAGFFSSIKFNDGVSKSPHPGGASGVLSLQNGRDSKPSVSAGVSFNQFMNVRSGAGFNIPAGKCFLDGNVQWEHLANEFSYSDPFKRGTPTAVQQHNDFSRRAVRIGFYSHVQKRIEAEVHAWLQSSALELPEPLGSYGASLATQRDSSVRLVAKLSSRFKRGVIAVDGAYFNENQHYTDRVAGDEVPLIDSKIQSERWYGKAEYRHFGETWVLNAAFVVNRESARSDNYQSHTSSRLLYGPDSHFIWQPKSWKVNVGARYDFGPGANVFVPDFSLAFIRSAWEVGAGAARIFRYPDLNELFWQPGGNQQLAPELGVTFNAYLVKSFNQQKATFTIAPFVKAMESLIVWEPAIGHYAAHNANSVKMNGLLMRIENSGQINRAVISEDVSVNIQNVSGLSEVHAGLFPAMNLRLKLSGGINNWRISMISRYTSMHMQPENLNVNQGRQDALLVFDLVLNGQKTLKNNNIHYSFGVFNIGNVMDYRMTTIASPGRTLNLSIQWQWKR
ncbi:MAG: TonB-dependent receptor [Cryomorphaceae bacterium]|nr:TonB-dependent receptor [Cryomorphaceae bacterium]